MIFLNFNFSKIFVFFISPFLILKKKNFERQCLFIEDAQLKVWKECLSSIEKGSFWNQKKISKSLSDFEITEFKDYQLVLENSLEFQKSPLNGEKILYWLSSSGTTGKRKLFPFTRSQMKQCKRLLPLPFYLWTQKFPDFLNHQTLTLVAPSTNLKTSLGVPIGYISYFSQKNTPTLFKKNFAIPSCLLENETIYEQWASLYALTSDVGSIFAITPAAITRLIENIKANTSFYYEFLKNNQKIPEPLPDLKISSKRKLQVLHFLEDLKNEKPLQLKKIWPNLSGISCWTDSWCALQFEALKPLLDSTIDIINAPYTSTEAWMTIPLLIENQIKNILHPGTHVFEFLPYKATPNKENLLKPWELKIGEYYEVILTNAMGLIRYRIKDVVCCNGYYQKSPLINFVFKSDHLLTLDSATFSESELIQACIKINLSTENILFCPNRNSTSIILLSKEDIPSQQIERLDQILQNGNHQYSINRKNGALNTIQFQLLLPSDSLLSHTKKNPQTKNSILIKKFPEETESKQ